MNYTDMTFEELKEDLYDYVRSNNAPADEELEALKPRLIEEGKKFTYPQLQEGWDSIVSNKIYGGYANGALQILTVIELMDALENGGMDKAVEVFNSIDKTVLNAEMIATITMHYSPKGVDFFCKVFDPLTQKQRERMEAMKAEHEAYEAELREKGIEKNKNK